MVLGAWNKFGAPMFEPKVSGKQMHCFEKSAYDIVVTFGYQQWFGARGIVSPCPPSLRLWCYSLKSGTFSENKQIFKSERHELQFYEHLQFSNTTPHGSCTVCQHRLLATFQVSSCSFCVTTMQGRIQGDDWGDRPPPKTYESNFIHHDFVQFGK